jgi:hypothetical protein
MTEAPREQTTMMPKCHNCGRFMAVRPGTAWLMVYDTGPLPCPDHEIFRCVPCVEKMGPFTPQLGIMPSYSCGITK